MQIRQISRSGMVLRIHRVLRERNAQAPIGDAAAILDMMESEGIIVVRIQPE